MSLDYWNKRSKNWLIGRSTVDKPAVNLENYINKFIQNKTILEIGVGTGRYLNSFKEYKHYYGIDFIESFINTAKKLKPINCTLSVDDIVNLKFNKNIDLVFTNVVLQHVSNDKIEKAISNIASLNPTNVILCEGLCNMQSNHYQFLHDYEKLFKEYKYNLKYSEMQDNNITAILHFTK